MIENIGTENPNYDFAALSISKLNIIVGKNGCGKSTYLTGLKNRYANPDRSMYIIPERGGVLRYEASVENNIRTQTGWVGTSRNQNRLDSFRQQSLSQYQKLELLVLRAHEVDSSKPRFETYIQKLNTLLDNIQVERAETGFKIVTAGVNPRPVDPDRISSGEAELISLGIEMMVFAEEMSRSEEAAIFFLDEPDVHLHPDLQVRLMNFIRGYLENSNIQTVLATHSTAILSAVADYPHAKIAFMKPGEKSLRFRPITQQLKTLFPVFGAHPLTSIFASQTPLLAEGEDDVRIWQQAVRTSRGDLRLYPCEAKTLNKLTELERTAAEVVDAVYEAGNIYSIRDGDGIGAEINDSPPVTRLRLNCRSAENLLLTTEVLRQNDITWRELERKIDGWLSSNTSHQYHADMNTFKSTGYDRRSHKLKNIRNILAGMLGNKTWEVTVGQAIGSVKRSTNTSYRGDNMLSYLGKKTAEALIPLEV